MKKIINKRIVVINVILFVLGLLAGIIFLISTSNLDKLIIKEEIIDFFTQIKTSKAFFNNFLISFKYNIMYLVIILVSSIIFIASPIILFVNFYKGFLIGFLISSIVLTYKLKGIIYALLILIPHHIIMILLIIGYSSIMLEFSYKLFKGTYKSENINLKLFIEKIGILFIGASLVSLIASLLEIYLNPILISVV